MATDFTVRVRKFMTNPLLERKQFAVEVLHPVKVIPTRDAIRTKLAATYKSEKNNLILYGFKTAFGGGRSLGFGLIYDSAKSMEKFEHKYRLARHGAEIPKRLPNQMRRGKKDIKIRKKKVRGIAKAKVQGGKKK